MQFTFERAPKPWIKTLKDPPKLTHWPYLGTLWKLAPSSRGARGELAGSSRGTRGARRELFATSLAALGAIWDPFDVVSSCIWHTCERRHYARPSFGPFWTIYNLENRRFASTGARFPQKRRLQPWARKSHQNKVPNWPLGPLHGHRYHALGATWTPRSLSLGASWSHPCFILVSPLFHRCFMVVSPLFHLPRWIKTLKELLKLTR